MFSSEIKLPFAQSSFPVDEIIRVDGMSIDLKHCYSQWPTQKKVFWQGSKSQMAKNIIRYQSSLIQN